MQRSLPLTSDVFRATLDAYAAEALADLDASMDLGRRAAVHPWADDVLADWLDAQSPRAQTVDVATGVLFGFDIARRAPPPRVVATVIEWARMLGAAGLLHAANKVAFVAARTLRDQAQPPALRRAARDVLEELLAHADQQSLQSVARQAARDALAGNPLP